MLRKIKENAGLFVLFALTAMCFRTVFACLFPFAAAFIAAGVTRRCGERIAKILRLSKPFSVAAVTAAATVLPCIAVGKLIKEGIRELLDAARVFDPEAAVRYAARAADTLETFVRTHMPPLYEHFAHGGVPLGEGLSVVSERAGQAVLSFLLSAVSALPSWLVTLAVTVFATFCFALDHGKVIAFAEKTLSAEMCQRVRKIRDACVTNVVRLISGYGALMFMTFSELLAGFLVMRLPYAVLAAFLTSLVDILPILGTGTVLVPWALILFAVGDTTRGLSMLMLYGVVTVVRQIAEPRVIGRSVGLHPLVSLAALYIGGRIGGIAGILVFPLAAAVAFGKEKPLDRNGKA